MPRTYGQMMQQVRAKETASGADTLTDADFNAPALEDSAATPAFSEEPYTEEPFVEEAASSSSTSPSKLRGARIGQIAPTVPEDIITPEMGGGIAGASYGARFSPAAAVLGARVAGPVGAAVGGTIPPVLGAAFGGAGVESFRQIFSALEGKEISPEEATKLIEAAAARQGGAELGGRTLVGGAKLTGNALMAWALRTQPEVAQTAIKFGINASKAGKAVLDKLWTAASNAERRMAVQAARSGVRVNAGEEIGYPAFQEVRKKLRGADTETIEKLKKLYQSFSNRGKITTSRALFTRKYADNEAEALWKARDMGKRGNPSLEEMWWKEVGDQSRRVLRAKVPGIASPDAYARLTGKAALPSELVRLKSVVDPIVARSPSLGRKIAQRGGLAAAGATAGGIYGATHGGDVGRNALVGGGIGAGLGLIGTPQFLSLAAQIATNPVLLQALSQLPRLAVSATQQEEAQ